MDEPRQLTSILGVLLAEGVQFVLVGALAAVAQGAPITTHTSTSFTPAQRRMSID